MTIKSRPSVALLVESSNAYSRGLLRGISSYVREHQSWSVFLPELERGHVPPASFSNWRGEGIIARIENDRIAHVVTSHNVPVVDLSAARRVPQIPWVETNDEMISRMAFEHLRERGLAAFAFCGEPRFAWSENRRLHFERIVSEEGYDCFTYRSPPGRGKASWQREKSALLDWVRQLPRPIGVMASFDIRGQQLLDVCRELDIAVPEQVAVVGVDNDDVICDLCEPNLSSVIPDTFRTGYMAAELLDAMMRGEPVEAKGYLLPPLGVQLRQSTDILATDDPLVVSALQYIRQHACDRIGVTDVAKRANVSRKMLDRHFQARLGRTTHAEIVRVRIDRVKRLLTETTLPLSVIADRTGFAYVEYLSVAFKRAVGVAPGEFRRLSTRRH